MADRLASYADVQTTMKGGGDVDPTSEKGTRLGKNRESVSARMMKNILRSSFYSLALSTSDGSSSPTEKYGSEHYGNRRRKNVLSA